MNTPNSLSKNNKSFISTITNNWENLEDSQKKILTKIWKTSMKI